MPASLPPPYVLPRVPRTEHEDDRLVAAVDRTLAGEVEAWQDLCLAVARLAWAVTASRRAPARLRRSKDDRLEIAVRVMDTLHEDGFRVLRELRTKGGRPGRAWIASLCLHAAVDRVREDAARLGDEANDGAGAAQFVALPAEIPEATVDPAWAIDARRVEDELFGDLDAPQQEALRHWLAGAGHAETAAAMALADARDAERLVSAALKRLQRRIAASGWK